MQGDNKLVTVQETYWTISNIARKNENFPQSKKKSPSTPLTATGRSPSHFQV